MQGSASWVHPEGRIAAFLGDFIDMGRTNRSVLTLVRAMRDQGHAVAIMGNHELNALLYHRPGLNADGMDDGYMRAHSAKNRDRHQTFLDEFPVGHPDNNEMLGWFLSLPLFLDLGGVRLVHACWDDARMATIRNRRPNGLLAIEDLQEIALENDATGFAEADPPMSAAPPPAARPVSSGLSQQVLQNHIVKHDIGHQALQLSSVDVRRSMSA